MITDPLICSCGARYFPRPDRVPKCRLCLAREKAAAESDDEFDDEPEGTPRYLPTQDEIAEACAEIRRGWTPAEMLSARRGVRRED